MLYPCYALLPYHYELHPWTSLFHAVPYPMLSSILCFSLSPPIPILCCYTSPTMLHHLLFPIPCHVSTHAISQIHAHVTDTVPCCSCMVFRQKCLFYLMLFIWSVRGPLGILLIWKTSDTLMLTMGTSPFMLCLFFFFPTS